MYFKKIHLKKFFLCIMKVERNYFENALKIKNKLSMSALNKNNNNNNNKTIYEIQKFESLILRCQFEFIYFFRSF